MSGSSQGSPYPGHSSRFSSCVSRKHSLTCVEADPSWACRERETTAPRQRFHHVGARVFNDDPPPPVASARTRARPARVKPTASAAGAVSRYRCARSAPAAVRTARRQWIEHAGHTPAPTAMWTSRQAWLTDLAEWLATEEGGAACRRLHIKTALVLGVATVLAAHADHATGRNCAIANATAAQGATGGPNGAGCSERTVTTVRALLRTSGLGVEARRGTGSAGFRRPSIWHLISRRQPVEHRTAGDAAPQPPAAVCDLPLSRSDRRLSLVRESSPKARTRAPQPESTPRRRASARRALRAPRPLAVQRLADELVGNRYGRSGLCHGLGRGHIGNICDALMAAGIDPDLWSAKALADALNANMRAKGWSWPDRIERPGAFLASALRALPGRPAGAPRGLDKNQRRASAQVSDAKPTATGRDGTQRWYADVTAATIPEQRSNVLKAHEVKFGPITDPFAALANAGRRAARLFPQLPLADGLTRWAEEVLGREPRTAAAKHIPAATSLSTELLIDRAIGKCECVVCAAPGAVERPQLPLRSMVCDQCWPVIAAQLDEQASDTSEEQRSA